MERYYQDGTEPTILPHMSKGTIIVMQCRDLGCHQGRLPCPHPEKCQPEAAEACSELGAEDQGKCSTAFWWLYATALVVAVTVVATCAAR